jgi:hypothetical protein
VTLAPQRSVPAGDGDPRSRARNRSLLRDGIVLLLVVVGLGLTWVVREVPNEEYPPALGMSQRLDDTYRAVRSGDLDIGIGPETVAPGITGARFERRTLADRWVLTGQVGSDCYVLWWNTDGVRTTLSLPYWVPCRPSVDAMSSRPGTYERIGRSVDETAATAAWEEVLPEVVRLRRWFFAALILGGGIGLGALVRITIALLTGDAPSATRR